jgi:hypothetical protein
LTLIDISDYIVSLVACGSATKEKIFSIKAFTLDGKIKKCDNDLCGTMNRRNPQQDIVGQIDL